MSRSIKFRAWDTIEKRWGESEYTTDDFFGDNFNPRPPKEFVFCQFIGLLDNNGKEIYEGDILKGGEHWDGDWNNSNFTVTYRDGCFFPFGAGDWEKESNAYEIIGNIYSNPELLK